MNNVSNYNLIINADPNMINNEIQKFLQFNNFTLVQNGNFQYFNSIKQNTNVGFIYSINGNNVNISSWIIGIDGNKYNLENNSPACIEYKNILNILFNELNKLQNPNGMINNNQNNNSNNNIQNIEKNVIAAFWISIVSLIIPFLGFSFWIITYIYNYYYGIVGLKTSKKGFAIATLILNSISLLFLILLMLF